MRPGFWRVEPHFDRKGTRCAPFWADCSASRTRGIDPIFTATPPPAVSSRRRLRQSPAPRLSRPGARAVCALVIFSRLMTSSGAVLGAAHIAMINGLEDVLTARRNRLIRMPELCYGDRRTGENIPHLLRRVARNEPWPLSSAPTIEIGANRFANRRRHDDERRSHSQAVRFCRAWPIRAPLSNRLRRDAVNHIAGSPAREFARIIVEKFPDLHSRPLDPTSESRVVRPRVCRSRSKQSTARTTLS